ncbi:MAG: helix-turn-helix domain-containing protein [Lachnospiraceae bacterium]|nr:helix-turn-helix domain-containing protein [Lachnospiraceae bacterium]
MSNQIGYGDYMKYMIRELRDVTGMTQKEFAAAYEIPLSTLRKWEQGEASPAPYILSLIARTLPSIDKTLMEIKTEQGECYYFDKKKQMVFDSIGNAIRVTENLEDIQKENLVIYLQDLFAGFYDVQEKFNRDCRYDKEENIIWTR